jgi:acyl carrier protein
MEAIELNHLSNNVKNTILTETRALIEAKSMACPALDDDTQFLRDTPMDSLDLATLLVTLEIQLGVDPFRDGFVTFHSVAELAELYTAALTASSAD